MFSSNCCFLTCTQISQEAGQVVWYSCVFKNFPQFVVIHTGLLLVNTNSFSWWIGHLHVELRMVWSTTNCGKFFKRWEYQTTLPASWEICVQVKKQQLELDMKQQTGSKLGKEYVEAVYCYPAYLYAEYFMQNARLEEAQAGIKISRRNINMQMTPPLWQKVKKN